MRISLCVIYSALIIFMCASAMGAYAQTPPVSGHIKDSLGQPVQYATVVLSAADSTHVDAVVTDSLGYFKLSNSDDKGAYMEISHLLFETISFEVGTATMPLEIILQSRVNVIDDVKVVGEMITHRDGKTIVNVAQMPNIERLQANEVMKRLPGVVDNKGSYQIGTQNATIYINGIEQKIPANSLYQYLTALPGSILSEVELIPNASGEYGGTTQAVINIKTKKHIPDGEQLQIGTNSGIYNGTYNDGGIGTFYMVKKGRVLFNSSIDYSNDNVWGRSTDSTSYSGGLSTVANGSHLSGRENVITNTNNLTINLNRGHELGINTFIYYDIGNARTNYNTSTAAGGIRDSRDYYYKNRSNYDLWSGSIYYTSPQDRNFTAKAYYYGMWGGQRNKMRHYNEMETGDEMYMRSRTIMEGHMHTLAGDFTNKFGDYVTLRYGVKADLGILNDYADYNDPTGADLSKSRFYGREIIPAAYLSVNAKISKSFGIFANARFEHTNYYLNFKTDNFKQSKNYTNIFPSLAIYLNTENYYGLLGVYSGISRPNYEWMLPGKRYVNENYYTEGNPDIKPSTYYMLYFGNTLFQYMQVKLRYTKYKDTFGGVYTHNSEGTYLVYMNYTDYNEISLEMVLPYRFLGGKIYGQLSGIVGYNMYHKFKNGFELAEGRYRNYWGGRANFYFQYDVTDRFNFNITAALRPRMIGLQSETKLYYNVDFEASYAFLPKKNLVFGCSIENLLATKYRESDVYFWDNFSHSSVMTKGPTFQFFLRFRFKKGMDIVDTYRNYTPDVSRMSGK